MPTDLRVDLGIVIADVGLGIGQHDKLGKIDPILGTRSFRQVTEQTEKKRVERQILLQT